MGEDALLQLVQQFLDTPQGQSLLQQTGNVIDVESINRRIAALDKDLSREERQKIRAERRNFRQQKREDRRKKRREEIQRLRAQLKGNIPVIRTFDVAGRLFDKNTGKPLEKTNIRALEAIVDKEKNSRPQTNSDGKFNIKLKAAVLPSTITINIENKEDGSETTKTVTVRPNDVILLNPKLLYTKGGYLPTTQVIKNLDNTLKTDLNVISLINIDVAAEEAINDLNNEIDKAKQKVNQFFLSGPEKIIVARRKQIMKVVGIIKNRLVPLAISLLITFGITKLIQKNQKVCPTPETLRDNVRRRNRIVKQLNQIFAALILNTSLAAVFTIIALKLRELRITLDSLPFPVSTPPGLGVPYSTIAQLQNVNDLLEELEKQNKDLNRQMLIALIFLAAALISILLLLRGIDKLTEECAGEENLEYEPISQELLDLTEEAEEEGIPVLTNVNGFSMSVITVDGVNELKRRQAIAKNKQGVIQLKGEPSFSSSDQVLIDELAFYITSNNLRAF